MINQIEPRVIEAIKMNDRRTFSCSRYPNRLMKTSDLCAEFFDQMEGVLKGKPEFLVPLAVDRNLYHLNLMRQFKANHDWQEKQFIPKLPISSLGFAMQQWVESYSRDQSTSSIAAHYALMSAHFFEKMSSTYISVPNYNEFAIEPFVTKDPLDEIEHRRHAFDSVFKKRFTQRMRYELLLARIPKGYTLSYGLAKFIEDDVLFVVPQRCYMSQTFGGNDCEVFESHKPESVLDFESDIEIRCLLQMKMPADQNRICPENCREVAEINKKIRINWANSDMLMNNQAMLSRRSVHADIPWHWIREILHEREEHWTVVESEWKPAFPWEEQVTEIDQTA